MFSCFRVHLVLCFIIQVKKDATHFIILVKQPLKKVVT